MQTKLILVRHAEAVGADVAGNDWDRWLSARGRQDIAQTAKKLVASELATGPIATSPVTRAKQTTEMLIAGRENTKAEPIILNALSTEDSSLDDARKWISSMETERLLTLVGHMPFLQELGAALCKDQDFPSLRTATAYILEPLTTRWNLQITIGP